MKKSYGYIIGLFLLLTTPLWAHPAHKALCHFRYNRSTKILEVELRFARIDVETFVRLTRGVVVDLDKLSDEKAKKIFIEEFSSHILLTNTLGKPYVWEWVGFENEDPFVWFYLEAPFDPKHLALTNKPQVDVFCAWEPEYNFLIDVLDGEKNVQSFISLCASP